MLSRIIVAGCGAMGLPMAMALKSADFDVFGYDVRPIAEFPDFREHMLASLQGLRSDDTLLLVVRDQQQISDICFGEIAVFRQNDYPHTLVISSTVSPRYISELKQQLPDDVELIDAPMSGAPIAARECNLSFMLGGNETAIKQLMPALQCMGTNIFHLGPIGQGMLAKVLNNYVAACNVISLRKSLAHAAQLGMPADKLLEVINNSSGSNWFSNRIDAIDWSHEDYRPDNTIGILEKDVTAALDVIDSLYNGQSNNPFSTTEHDEFGHAMLSSLKNLPSMPDRE